MYRVNSIAKSLVTFQVIENGTPRTVNLLPRNFVFTDKLTSQIENLVAQRVLRVSEVKAPASPQAQKSPAGKGSSVRALNK